MALRWHQQGSLTITIRMTTAMTLTMTMAMINYENDINAGNDMLLFRHSAMIARLRQTPQRRPVCNSRKKTTAAARPITATAVRGQDQIPQLRSPGHLVPFLPGCFFLGSLFPCEPFPSAFLWRGSLAAPLRTKTPLGTRPTSIWKYPRACT